MACASLSREGEGLDFGSFLRPAALATASRHLSMLPLARIFRKGARERALAISINMPCIFMMFN